MLELADKVYGKHTAGGAASPLNTLTDYDWAKIGPTIAKAQRSGRIKGKNGSSLPRA
jgi:hypothetical protein